MSTRCQIGIYEDEKKKLNNYTALIYRHSDGYPDGNNGVLITIVPFIKQFIKERENDEEYLSARLLQKMTNDYDLEMKKIGSEFGIGILGYGICNQFHPDIAYFYAIYPDKIKVYEVHNVDWEKPINTDDWKVIQEIKINNGV